MTVWEGLDTDYDGRARIDTDREWAGHRAKRADGQPRSVGLRSVFISVFPFCRCLAFSDRICQ